jgi:hypothetical protein
MFHFLVKLANRLDDIKRYDLAARIDQLIQKCAQDMGVNPDASATYKEPAPTVESKPEDAQPITDNPPVNEPPTTILDMSQEPGLKVDIKTNPKIKEIQKALGVKETGVWGGKGSETDKAFIDQVSKIAPDAFVNGRFQGSLDKALQLVRSIDSEDKPFHISSPAPGPVEVGEKTETPVTAPKPGYEFAPFERR